MKAFTDLSENEKKVYNYIRNEIAKARVQIKLSVDYYGNIANKLQWYSRISHIISLVSSSSAAYLVFFTSFPKIAGSLALIAAISSIINVVSKWGDVKSQFLQAQQQARSLEQKIDNLWVDIDSELRLDSEKSKIRLDQLLEEYHRIEQLIQPHFQKRKLALSIQDRIEEGLEEKEQEDE